MTARDVFDLLRRYESRNVTFIERDGSWPIVWKRAKGVHVWDAAGKKYLDLTAAFGVAAAGHANPRVVNAGRKQMATLLHAMGDVHPHAHKAELARELSRITFERWTARTANSELRTPNSVPLLRRVCTEHAALLILDEIYTGLGRTGKWFACEHSGVIPDLICLGKALAGGFPLSACVGRADIMDAAWPPATGEAIHTSTFLGHPVGCVMALAQIKEIRRLKLAQRSARLGLRLRAGLARLAERTPDLNLSVRGHGLLAGLELRHLNGSPATESVLRLLRSLLRLGFILLPEGEHSNVISFTPPLTISESDVGRALEALSKVLNCQ